MPRQTVKPRRAAVRIRFAAVEPPRQTGPPFSDADVPPTPGLLLALLALGGIVLVLHLRARRRRRALAGVLDAADAFESRLRLARAQLGTLAGDPVRDALQEMLRQRLWLQQHGARAGIDALDAMRDSIAHAQARVDRQLAEVAMARAGAGS